MNILGISAFYHDSAACLVQNGKIIAAAQEERFTRIKHDSNYPEKAITFCLDEGKISSKDLDLVVFYEKPFIKFERILETYLHFVPQGYQSYIKAIPIWIKKKIWMKELLREKMKYKGEMIFLDHHESHAASAFFPSPFKESAILTLDGVGEWATTTYGLGKGNSISLLEAIQFPHSLGLLYSALTYYLGFKVNSGEYKVMGLASYGNPKYIDLFYEHLVDVKADGSFHLNMKYFNYCVGLTMTNASFDKLFGAPPRKSESSLTQKDMDIAASLQFVTEDIVLKISKTIYRKTKQENLCLAGGVALNCVANGRLLREGPFKNIWIQPAAGDAGGALGSALFGWYQYKGNKRVVVSKTDCMEGAYLGPVFSDNQIQHFMEEKKIPYEKYSEKKLLQKTSEALNRGKVIGWFQGRMEFGPRALGNRSILGDPRSPKMQKIMNVKIKFRESFRPFAPAILAEHAKEYFDLETSSPYMLIVAEVNKKHRKSVTKKQEELFGLDKLYILRSDIPAVTHVDFSARVQTVHKDTNPRFHALLKEFYLLTNCPLLINTSFNVRGEPLVCNPEDAYRCFMRTDMDYLVMGNYLVDKHKQTLLQNDEAWKQTYTLD